MQQTSESTSSLSELLAHLTKNQLDMIRRVHQIKNASNLKKKELISRLSEYFIAGLEDRLRRFDEQRYGMLQKVLSRGGAIPFDEIVVDEDYDPDYFVESGCLFINNEQGIVEMPLEISEQLQHVNIQELEPKLAQNTEWIQLAKGLLFYHGTLDNKHLSEQITKYASEPLNYRECFDLIYEYSRYDFLPFSHAGFSHYMVDDSKWIMSEHKARPSVEYYPFTKEQLLLASDDDFVDRHEGYLQFVQFLMNNWDMVEEEADMLTEDLTFDIQNGGAPSELISNLQAELDFDSMEQIQRFMEILMQLMNQTRQWILKGHTSTELFAEEKKNLMPLPKEPFQSPSAEVYDFKTKQKVGRNDACPCGSGKKYKKCCGG